MPNLKNSVHPYLILTDKGVVCTKGFIFTFYKWSTLLNINTCTLSFCMFTVRPNQFGVLDAVPQCVPHMLNIPQTPPAKSGVSLNSC